MERYQIKDHLFQQALRVLEAAFATLEEQVEKPQQTPFMDGFVFRYQEKSVHQALIQKLARIVTGLHAARILLEKGFVQELCVLQRMLDELQEDVTFLSYGIIFGELTGLHKKYLTAFYEEDFDNPHDPVTSANKRVMIPRKKIRAYIVRMDKSANRNPSRGVEVSKFLQKAYSGFVHAASPHIMDMYGGNPPRFQVSGMRGTPKIVAHSSDLWNYFFRGILAFLFSAKAFGNDRLVGKLLSYRDQFEEQSSTSYGVMAREET